MNRSAHAITQRLPRSAIMSALFLVAVFYGIAHLLWYYCVWLDAPEQAYDVSRFSLGVLYVALFLYGACRGWVFHPALDRRYREWLAATPWSPDRPLPFGPVHLVLDDLIFLGVCVGMGLLESFSIAYLPLALLAGHSVGLIMINHLTRSDWGVFVPVALATSAILVFRHPALIWLIAISINVVAYAAVRRGMRAFPWRENSRLQKLTQRPAQSGRTQKTRNAAWPLVDRENRQYSGQPISYRRGAWLAALSGWCVFCGLFHFADTDGVEAFVHYIPLGVGFVGAVMRLLYYCDGRPPAVGLWVRLVTLRPIVSGYDRVLLTPMLGFATGLLSPWLLLTIGVPPVAAAAIAVAATVAVTFNAGPTLAEWNYTGHHRIVVAGFEPQQRNKTS